MSRPRPAPKVGPYRELVRQWLLEDGNAPRKQRHTARRIYQRLRDEHGYEGAESTIRRVVAQLRRELDTDGAYSTEEAFSMGGRAISTPSGWTRSLNTMEPLYEPLPHRQLAGFRPYPLK